MNFIHRQYHEIKVFYKTYIKHIFPITILVFFFSIMLSTILIGMNPGLATRLLLKTGSLVDSTSSSFGLLPTIFQNLFAGFYLLGLGVVPFLFIPLIIVILNGGVIGVLLGSTTISNVTYSLILASILPHGIVLIPTTLLAASYGVFLCKAMIRHITKKPPILSFRTLLIAYLRIYVLILLPSMITVSILKEFITPLIVSLL